MRVLLRTNFETTYGGDMNNATFESKASNVILYTITSDKQVTDLINAKTLMSAVDQGYINLNYAEMGTFCWIKIQIGQVCFIQELKTNPCYLLSWNSCITPTNTQTRRIQMRTDSFNKIEMNATSKRKLRDELIATTKKNHFLFISEQDPSRRQTQLLPTNNSLFIREKAEVSKISLSEIGRLPRFV